MGHISGMAVGLLHPGRMGAALGAHLRRHRARVIWAAEGRSDKSCARAQAAGLEEVATVADLVAASETLLSVIPPHGALPLAEQVAALGFTGLYVDANAVAPTTMRRIAERLQSAGARTVDASIIGPAPRPLRLRLRRRWGSRLRRRSPRALGYTTVYISGAQRADAALLLDHGSLEVVDLGPRIGAASALKTVHASFRKGTFALSLASAAVAEHEGVDRALLGRYGAFVDAWADAETHSRDAWRHIGEMEEHAAAIEEAGAPSGMSHAATELLARLESYRDAESSPSLDEIVRTLTGASADVPGRTTPPR